MLAFYWQGLSHAEAAAELATSPGAVKSRLHQARAALAPRLALYAEQEREALPVPTTKGTTWVEVKVAEVRRAEGEDPTSRVHAVVLEEVGGDRRLPIYIGAPRGVALACSLEAVETPRPMTYQFAADLAHAGGSAVTEVRVTRLTEYTFYAAVAVEGPAGPAEVDARPSDALNLALVAGAGGAWTPAVFDYPTCTATTHGAGSLPAPGSWRAKSATGRHSCGLAWLRPRPWSKGPSLARRPDWATGKARSLAPRSWP